MDDRDLGAGADRKAGEMCREREIEVVAVKAVERLLVEPDGLDHRALGDKEHAVESLQAGGQRAIDAEYADVKALAAVLSDGRRLRQPAVKERMSCGGPVAAQDLGRSDDADDVERFYRANDRRSKIA